MDSTGVGAVTAYAAPGAHDEVMARSFFGSPALVGLLLLATAACGDDDPGQEVEDRCAEDDALLGVPRPAGWTAATHCKHAPGNVAAVFSTDVVHTLVITMTAAEYAAMQDDLEKLMGGGPFLRKGFGVGPDPCAGRGDGDTCSQGSSTGTCVSAGGPLICQVDAFDPANVDNVPPDEAAPFWPREPYYFHADLTFDGIPYTSVGIRYKGNNGLARAEGEKKPFRLKLDEWEDEVPAIDDQRLYGFQALSLSPNQTDDSQLHQVLAAETFRGQGVPAPYAGFVEVSLDTGSGPRLLGLYALTEIPDKPLLVRGWGDDEGNLYKADGRGAHFVSFETAAFHKENNDLAPHDDVQAFVTALHAPRADRAAWRAGLRARFDIDGFVEAFAVNQAIGNWDTYGMLAHNFFLYGEPETGRLHYIPWDFDLAFDSTGPSDLTLRSFDGSWPLLQAVARDADLMTRYQAALRAFADEQLVSGALVARVDALEALVRPAIMREDAVRFGTRSRFDAGVASLRFHLEAQRDAIAEFLP